MDKGISFLPAFNVFIESEDGGKWIELFAFDENGGLTDKDIMSVRGQFTRGSSARILMDKMEEYYEEKIGSIKRV